MYFTQLKLGQHNRDARRDLADVQQMHRTIMSAFPNVSDTMIDNPRQRFGVLHRLDINQRTKHIDLLVQSFIRPDWKFLSLGYVHQEPSIKDVSGIFATLREGQKLAFRLRANPTRKIMTKSVSNGRKPNGKRVALSAKLDPVSNEIIKDVEQVQIDWLQRKGQNGGFNLVSLPRGLNGYDVRAKLEGRMYGSQRRKTFNSVLYQGHLQITNRGLFLETLRCGIGPAKAYGFGLLSVAPPRK